jgi:hypothetical protein
VKLPLEESALAACAALDQDPGLPVVLLFQIGNLSYIIANILLENKIGVAGGENCLWGKDLLRFAPPWIKIQGYPFQGCPLGRRFGDAERREKFVPTRSMGTSRLREMQKGFPVLEIPWRLWLCGPHPRPLSQRARGGNFVWPLLPLGYVKQ